MSYKLEEEFFPDEMTEANTIHCFGESFFITKKDPDGISRKNWNVYNWETRNLVICNTNKERVIGLTAIYYERIADKDKISEPLFFSPPQIVKKIKAEDVQSTHNIGCGSPDCEFCKGK
ncbi:MAG: hypothetical protein K0U20_09335 [Proteobacteria bacterium]|nr:hypothetical protein [Pseudomonadota bacterium]MCH9735783.1 hypothetical protein [Actinomycetes bacterium]